MAFLGATGRKAKAALYHVCQEHNKSELETLELNIARTTSSGLLHFIAAVDVCVTLP
jgi:hypothetical protein